MVSIIIPSYNSEKTIVRTLKALIYQDYPGEYEIILVDSSDDLTPTIVREQFPTVQLIHVPHQIDPGAARNQGIAIARGELLVFIDADCVATSDWLQRHVTAHAADYAAVGGAVVNSAYSQNAVGWAGYFCEFREFIPEQPAATVKHIPTCNISYKKEIFKKLGGFQGQYYPQEDLVFNHQLVQQNLKIFFDPAIQIFHTQRTDLKNFLRHQQRIGRVTASVLRRVALDGSFLVQHRWVTLPIICLLPWVKFLRTALIFLKLAPATFLSHPMAVGWCFLGLLRWGYGFLSEHLNNSHDMA
ncbi:glycosyltransferase [candidate division KSB1 bacterium]|nr:glycosyltransferase [candidate division KSB1 bacterium]